MEEIDAKDAARLTSMIYRPDLMDEWSNTHDEYYKCMVGDLVNTIEATLKDESSSSKYGGEMTKEEYQDVINQIKSSQPSWTI